MKKSLKTVFSLFFITTMLFFTVAVITTKKKVNAGSNSEEFIEVKTYSETKNSKSTIALFNIDLLIAEKEYTS